MRKALVALFLLLVPSMGICQDAQPLRLTVALDKASYKEGEKIALRYTIENISGAPVGFLKGFLHPKPTSLEGQPLESHDSINQYMAGQKKYEYILLKPGEKFEATEEFAKVIFDEVQDYAVSQGKFINAARYIKKDGLLLKQWGISQYLPDWQQGRFLINCEYVITDPNPYKFNLTREECEQAKKDWNKVPTPEDIMAGGGLPDWERMEYCNNYDALHTPVFIGTLKTAPVQAQLDMQAPPDGVVKSYYDDGKVRVERTYKDGVLNGVTKYFYPEYYMDKGSPDYGYAPTYGIRNYSQGKLVGEAKDCYDNDQPAITWNYADGKLEGESKAFLRDGKLLGEAHFHNGELDGELKQYEPDGTLTYSAHFSKGKLEGPEYHFTQILATPPPYLGREVGTEGGYKAEGNYKDGKRDGVFTSYDTFGRKTTESTFKEDVLVRTRVFGRDGKVVYDHDDTCEAGKQRDTYSMLSAEVLMFLKKIEMRDEGITIWMKDGFASKYQLSPVFLNKSFDENGRMFIPKAADLAALRLEGFNEPAQMRKYAAIAAYRAEDKQDPSSPFICLYIGKFPDGRNAIFMVKSPAERGEMLSQTMVLSNDFDDNKQCNEAK